jgi:hypothetical protein
MRAMKNIQKTLVANLKSKSFYGHLGVAGKIILRWILGKQVMRMGDAWN